MRVGRKTTNPETTDPGLARLQALLYRLIAAPEGVAAGLAAERENIALDELLAGDERMTAAERLEIYANAYFHRILDCLKEDFPGTLASLGADNFHNLITGYLIEHPPTEPSISHAGRHLAAYLRGHPLRERWPFIAELAHLERTLLEVFHAADAEPLDAQAMRAVAPRDWAALALRTHPASSLVDCEWRVDKLLREIEAAAGETKRPLGPPDHAPATLLVWRKDWRAHYRATEPAESAALKLARTGTTFAAVCETVARAGADADPAATINRLLIRWLDEGVLVRPNERPR